MDEPTVLERKAERALERRRYIYKQGLFAKHVATNRYTGFKSIGPEDFAKNADLRKRVTMFARREVSQLSHTGTLAVGTLLNKLVRCAAASIPLGRHQLPGPVPPLDRGAARTPLVGRNPPPGRLHFPARPRRPLCPRGRDVRAQPVHLARRVRLVLPVWKTGQGRGRGGRWGWNGDWGGQGAAG